MPYAFNPALNSFGDGMGVPVFVRPDCPPEDAASASAASKREKRGKAAAPGARPQFRSALEQVQLLRTFLVRHQDACLSCIWLLMSSGVFPCRMRGWSKLNGWVLMQVSYMTNNKLWSDEEAEHAQKFAPLRFLGL